MEFVEILRYREWKRRDLPFNFAHTNEQFLNWLLGLLNGASDFIRFKDINNSILLFTPLQISPISLFYLSPPLPSNPPSFWPHCCLCLWVMHICSLADLLTSCHWVTHSLLPSDSCQSVPCVCLIGSILFVS